MTGEERAVAGERDARGLYARLLESPENHDTRNDAQRFLKEQLGRASELPHDFPEGSQGPEELEAWMERKARDAGERYAAYLDGRKQGAPRRYFATRSHALYFLQQAAPTKLVDGAWLYGLLPYWKDLRFHGLVRTYLEELGDGIPEQNHVMLYQRLLAGNGCEPLARPGADRYVQGAIQLAFAYNAERFLPELIGYNLGYEQLPLHLLITAFELAELDIDPYYFTLHVTIDNAGTGHARKAARAVKDCMPALGDSRAFRERVANGYQLNDLGPGAEDIVRGFDLEREIEGMLERKRAFGRHMHSDYCLIDGRTVNQWLSEPGQMPAFLRALEARGWINRHQAPPNSRFWMMIDGPKAPMAGVFNGYEKQLLHDWIAGDQAARATPVKRRVFPRYRPEADLDGRSDDVAAAMDPDEKILRRELQTLGDSQRMQRLIEFMSPSRHATPAGLFATREFAAIVGRRG